MKKLTINDIKDILRTELEKSKRHVQHYYLGTNRFSETDRLKSILNNQEQEDQFRGKLKQDYKQTLKEINPKVHQVLEEQGYDPVKVDSLEFKQLREQLIQLKLDQFEQKRVLLTGELERVETVNPEPTPSVTIQDSMESIKLSELCDRFITSREEMGATSQTVSDYIYSTELLLEIVTDIPISNLGHQHGRELVQILKKLPKNRKKYPDQSINDLLKMKNVEVLSDSTIKKIFNKILTLFNWSINQGYLSQNVFKGKLDLTQKKPVIEKHFTTSELELICGDQLKKESFSKDRPERYWVSMISLYSGSRLNEICQVNLSDIEDQDGIWVMKITNDSEDKSVKTRSGNRIVPLHPQLIALGLLNYVEEIRNRNETKLFPNLKRSQVTSYGSQVSQWFGRYLKNLGIKKKGKNFHSFRHTAVNHLPSKQVYEPFIKELVGHSHGTVTMDVYGGRKPLEVLLNECVVKLNYGIEGEESE